jgi:hypothetical protein
LRTNIIETFQDTLSQCFSLTLENIFGRAVKEQLMQVLADNNIPRLEIGVRFDDVARILTNVFGNSSRLLIYRTVVELYEEYSVRPTFGFYDSLRDQILFLQQRVLADIMKPRHTATIDDSIYTAGHRPDNSIQGPNSSW